MNTPWSDAFSHLPPPPGPPSFDAARQPRPTLGSQVAYVLGVLGMTFSAVGLATGALMLFVAYQEGTDCVSECGGFGIMFVFILLAMGVVAFVGFVSLLLYLTGRSRVRGRS